jgi:hypothetical protein
MVGSYKSGLEETHIVDPVLITHETKEVNQFLLDQTATSQAVRIFFIRAFIFDEYDLDERMTSNAFFILSCSDSGLAIIIVTKRSTAKELV